MGQAHGHQLISRTATVITKKSLIDIVSEYGWKRVMTMVKVNFKFKFVMKLCYDFIIYTVNFYLD